MIRSGQLRGKECFSKFAGLRICISFILLLSIPCELFASSAPVESVADGQVVTVRVSYDSSTSSGNELGTYSQGIVNQSDCNSLPITIGSGINTWDYPMHTYYHDSRTQVIYLASEIRHAGTIRSLSLNVATIPGQVMNNWTIRMKYTNSSVYNNPASFEPIDSGWTTVYQANEPQGSTGWRTFTFSTPFEYNGTSNLLIDFSHNNSSYTASGYCYYSTPGGIRSAYAFSDSGYDEPLKWTGTTFPTVYGSSNVPDIELAMCVVLKKADLNQDGRVDMLDYAILANQWQQSPGVPSADIAPPVDIVDYEDLAVMASQWLQGVYVVPLKEADLNQDGRVDMLDYAILANQWLQAPATPSADIAPPGGDAAVDYQDLAVMAAQWLQGL